MNSYPRETKEFIAVTVTVDEVSVLSGVEFSVTDIDARPVTWIPSVTLDGEIGVMTDHQPVGFYAIWARITDFPEIPVIRCGEYSID